MKKSHELAVLCDVDVALFIFSGRGRLYEFSTGERYARLILLSEYEKWKIIYTRLLRTVFVRFVI